MVAECGWRRVLLSFGKTAEDLSGADDPCKSIPCLWGRKGSVTQAMNDKLKIKNYFADLTVFSS